jgi:hypothetical protein
MRLLAYSVVPLLMLAQATTVGAQALPTDANLITAIDVSGSVDPATEDLQFDGIADAILEPAFLQTVAAGYHGRVGFAAFTWSSHGHFLTLVPWTAIDSPTTAAKIAAQLRKVRSRPRQFPPSSPGSEPRPWRRDLMTDVSATIEQASGLLARAPFATAREVINVLANGPDNVADSPDTARAWAISRGIVINALVLGSNAEVVAYFREHVQTGAGSFVLATQQPSDVTWAMLQKFLLDLAGHGSDQVG